ncbi:MAG: amine oxidase [Chitinophagaceae bacterium]|nr:MAG: amine oxidase [Chitinophagaceae bacterium]
MAGYECTDKLNAFGNRVDFLKETDHLQQVATDYQLLQSLSIRTVREGLRWSQVERTPYNYDWTEVRILMAAAREAGIQQVWDLCHFGYPDDLTPLHPLFPRRFAAFAEAFVSMYREEEPDQVLVVTPINEVSFISWLGGDVAGTSPYCRHNGWEVKYNLMKAYIEAIEKVLAVDPRVRIMTTEPLVNIIAGPGATNEEVLAAERANNDQFQVLEILAGRMCPELRGRADYLDILGFNYYYPNQWIHSTNDRLDWADPEPAGGLQLSVLLTGAFDRYQRPLVLSETSYPGHDRPLWIEMLGREYAKLRSTDIPLWGICWYPVIDRPDWDHLTPWHNAGIWDNDAKPGTRCNRVLHQPTFTALKRLQDHMHM